MALFGSPPNESSLAKSPSEPRSKSLFENDTASGAASNSSLFAGGPEGNHASPWSLPTPKKAGRSHLVKTLLPASDVPESYIDAFDTVLESGYSIGANASLLGIERILKESGLHPNQQAKIRNLVVPDDEATAGGVGRSEVNVLLALIGLAQEDDEVTLDGVDERRRNLPSISLPALKRMNSSVTLSNGEATKRREKPMTPPSNQEPAPTRSRQIPRESFGDAEVDPWASPALHKNHTHIVKNDATPTSNGITAARPIGNGFGHPSRTTSAFTTHSEDPSRNHMSGDTSSREPSSNEGDGGWGSSRGYHDTSQPSPGSQGFGSAGDDRENSSNNVLGRSVGGGRTTGRAVEEFVTVTVLSEIEGVFLFQHRNYEVKSARRGSSVVRRYSDFVWLLDCLHKRYPFRQLPLLPPKRVAVNGRHLSSDVTFIEKRRRGLARFTNALVRHPILSQEQLVVMFLTVPTELAVWRKQATISVQEEFISKVLPPGLEDSLPTNLLDTFDTVRAGTRRSADAYINLCTLLERLAKRNQGVAADHLRFSQALTALTESSESTYAVDTNDVPLLNEGISSTAKHLSTCQALLEDEARAWDEGVLEDFKRQRDALVSIRDMFDRRDRLAKDNIPQLERRIEANQNKLASLRGRPAGTVKPGEEEKVEQAIQNDKQSIVDQHARGVFIKECIRDELVFFQQSQYHVTKLHQDWSQDRIKYAELQAENWRALGEEVESMPTGE